MKTILELQQEIVAALRTVYDPEISVNVYDLGLVYRIDVSDDFDVEIDMTLTAPNCPMADDLVEWAKTAVKAITGVRSVNINLVFDPPWSQDMLSDEAKLDLGLY